MISISVTFHQVKNLSYFSFLKLQVCFVLMAGTLITTNKLFGDHYNSSLVNLLICDTIEFILYDTDQEID